MTERTFYVVRHGQTDWNVAMRWQGHTDIPLNEMGRAQARRLAVRLADIPFDRAVSSDSSRAQETARLALGERTLELETHTDFREFNAGKFEGLTWDEIRTGYPDHVTAMNTDWFGYVFPEGESRGVTQARSVAAFRRLLDDGVGTHILVATHGMTLRGLLHGLFPDLIEHPMRLSAVENTSLAIIKQADDTLTLYQMPDASHLIEITETPE